MSILHGRQAARCHQCKVRIFFPSERPCERGTCTVWACPVCLTDYMWDGPVSCQSCNPQPWWMRQILTLVGWLLLGRGAR